MKSEMKYLERAEYDALILLLAERREQVRLKTISTRASLREKLERLEKIKDLTTKIDALMRKPA